MKKSVGQGSRRVFAVGLWLVSIVAVLISLLALVSPKLVSQGLGGRSGAFGGILIAMAVGGVAAAIRVLSKEAAIGAAQLSRQMTVPTAAELVSRDPRPPVLYLRSFGDDAAGRSIDRTVSVSYSSRTEEEQLAKVASELGPFVAVGRREDSRPELGAARMYLSDNEWQQRVIDLLRMSRVVLLRTGITPGVAWELQMAVRLLLPERLVLLVDEGDESYAEFRDKMGRYLPRGVPPLPDKRAESGALRGVIRFDSAWAPSFYALNRRSAPWFRRSMTFPLAPALKYALAPLWRQSGLTWKPPPPAFSVVASVSFLALIAGGCVLLVGMAIFKPKPSYRFEAAVAAPELAQPDPFAEMQARSSAFMLNDPDARAWSLQTFGVDGGSSEAAAAAIRKLIVLGLPHLDDGVLLQWLTIRRSIWQNASLSEGQALVDGTLSDAMLERLLRSLAKRDLDRWLEINQMAMKAVWRPQAKPDLMSSSEAKRLLKSAARLLSKRGELQLARALESPPGTTEKSPFEVEVALMDALLALPDPEARRGGRFVAYSLVMRL